MLLALACDFRLMSSGKGWMSMNELLIGVPLQQGTAALLGSKIPPQLLRDVMLGKRWTSQEAKAAGFLDEVVDTSADAGALMRRAVEFAEAESPKVALETWGGIKEGLYGWVGERLRNNPPSMYPKDQATLLFDRMEGRKANL